MIGSDQIARQAKLFVDSGRDTQDEAIERLRGLQVTISIGDDACHTSAGQAAFLTAVATAVRCFAGGVFVKGNLEAAILTPLAQSQQSLALAATELGASLDAARGSCCEVLIGNAQALEHWSIRAVWSGWQATCQPGADSISDPIGENPLAAVAAAALAVGNAFHYATGSVRAGYCREVLSLWSPDQPVDRGPSLKHFPDKVWLFGLGNLGQAFAWALSSIECNKDAGVQVHLQDFDRIKEENWGTSILAPTRDYGELKTALAERWLKGRDFSIYRVDRAIDERFRVHPQEPALALAGLDDLDPRRWLGAAGFINIIDVGLGATHTDYTKIRVNVFDREYGPLVHFAGAKRTQPDLKDKAPLKGYREIEIRKGRCGIEQYAGFSIAYTFVSAVAACLALAQAVRICTGEAPYASIGVDTADLRNVKAQIGKRPLRPQIGNVRL